MSRYRVGRYISIVFDGYAIQKKRWYGWSTLWTYDWKENAIADAKKLEDKGHNVEWYI